MKISKSSSVINCVITRKPSFSETLLPGRKAFGALMIGSQSLGVATVTSTGDLTYQAAEGDAGLPFKITKADLKADKMTGTQKFDVKTGRLSSATAQLDLSGSMTIGVGGQSIDAKLRQKMKTDSAITSKNPIVD